MKTQTHPLFPENKVYTTYDLLTIIDRAFRSSSAIFETLTDVATVDMSIFYGLKHRKVFGTIAECQNYQHQHDVSGIVEALAALNGKQFYFLQWERILLLQDRDLDVLTTEAPAIARTFVDALKADFVFYIDVSEPEDDDRDLTEIEPVSIFRHAKNAVYCCVTGHENMGDDEALLTIYLDRPDKPSGEYINIIAKRR